MQDGQHGHSHGHSPNLNRKFVSKDSLREMGLVWFGLVNDIVRSAAAENLSLR